MPQDLVYLNHMGYCCCQLVDVALVRVCGQCEVIYWLGPQQLHYDILSFLLSASSELEFMVFVRKKNSNTIHVFKLQVFLSSLKALAYIPDAITM